MKRLAVLAVLLLLVLLPAGCTRPKQKTVGISVLTLTNPFFKEIADVFTAEMSKQGFEVIAVSGDNDVAKQRNQVKDFLSRGVSAIVLCPCDSKGIGAVIREANAKGVPVFTADIACTDPDAQVVTHVATDNYGGGKQAANAIIEALGEGGGKILVLDFKDVESCQQRMKGFHEVIAAHNATGKGKVEIVAELPGQGDKEKAQKVVADVLTPNPDLAGIFAINDPSALGARAALERAKRADRVKIVGFDGQPEGKKAILEGKIYADPIQHPDEIARKTAAAIRSYLDGDQPAKEILIPTNLYRKADAEKEFAK